ncbi:permease [Endozoicomonas montiporae CL-33]|nr:permease [Endozoicomonas montiporae CL-33]
MTPLLLVFGFPAHIAIGTDLMYAALTKSGGVLTHHRQKSVDWLLVKAMCAGSIPTTIATIITLKYMFAGSDHYSLILTTCLGFMLSLTALVLFFRRQLMSIRILNNAQWSDQRRFNVTVMMGALLGVLVTLSSVGAGALGTAILLMLYPMLSPVKVVGTDIAHAVPLTLVAGLGHIWLGNVDFGLLGVLLIGSLPAVHFGTRLGRHLPENAMRILLASILLILGIRYLI